MENSLTPVARRSWSRRLLRWFAAGGMLAGAVWGVAQWKASVDAEPPAKLAVSTAAQQQIQQLFDTLPADGEPESTSAIARTAVTDRYATTAPPELPPLAEPVREVAPVVDVAPNAEQPLPQRGFGLPAAAIDANDDANNNASTDAAPAVPEQSKEGIVEAPAVDTPPIVDQPDVARGQEPDLANPLRQATHTAAQVVSGDQARNAFADAFAAQTPESAPGPTDEGASQFESARPLPGAQPAYRGQPAATPPMAALPQTAVPASEYRNSYADAPTPTIADEHPLPATRAAPPMAIEPQVQAPARTPEFAGAPLPNTPPTAVTPTPGLRGVVGAGRPGERVLEGPQSPAITVQKLAPPEIQVGKKCTFAVRVQNNGQRTAQQVIVYDEIPLGTQLVGTSPRASVSGSQVEWDLGTLSVGEERIVEMELMPTDEGDLGSVAVVTFAAEASAKARCTKPELRLRLTTQPQVMVGQQHLVQIEISNPGSGDATNVMLLESLPNGVSHEAGAALEFEVGTLRAGETRRLDLVLTAEQAGLVENVMTARADASLQTTGSCQFEVIAPALAISLEGPRRKYLERPAKFVVNIDNPGTASAKEVQLVAQLPKGLQYVNANNMGEYDQATHSVYWSLAELPANERGSVELTTLPIAPGEHTIRAATKAQQGLEDRAESSLQVDGMAALSFETRALENLIEIGGETTCEVRVTNRGSKAASNVSVSASMPAGLRAVSAKGDTQHQLQANQVTFAPLLQLAPGAEAIYHVTAQGVAPGDQRVKVRVTSDDEQPITKEASARVYADQ